MILKYIPNALSILRLLLIAPFVWYLSENKYQEAFYVFIVAGFTDGLDGWLARHFNWQSFFGSLADPLADKLLVSCSFISLAVLNVLPWWLVLLVFSRDFTISIGVLAWYFLIQKKLQFEPTMLSKFNTSLQLLLVTICLFKLAEFQIPNLFLTLLIYLTTLTTLITYIDYVWTWGRRAWFEAFSNHE